ncbi:MAG: hypothetical protein A2751_01785 [Candidatus Doudnabacteria bacterium RIFCSPHIGHO2_01_FULL_46_14]|uniref:Uncharacterized protein n=1 Tax=Candidatus Doudnabacteria bacterium RIFCSPHIGHO2_01_FULL_46_14 TaxID=1817824 RepID=A0A1F5NJ90_9BACT|nr:MAG: hypothetical protein A2751_01785 [Candidatus Doudnabacteria bacterium RIFCSPHIGHO2_01_FULL_46_14]
MKKLNLVKIVNVLAIIAVFVMIVSPLAVSAQFTDPDPTGKGVASDTDLTTLLVRIINILLSIAGLVAVIFLIVGGFRYITAGGNEEAAEAGKKAIVNAIIGIVIIILSFVIVRVVANAVK